ncbi:MAG: hypothetical protein ACR2FY_02550 [Pirellulaceae bacterium]
MLKRILHFLFDRQPPRESFTDPVLGELKAAEAGWTVSIVKDNDCFSFTIGGTSLPDAALLAHAHDILREYDSFKKSIHDFMQAESIDYLDDVKAELARLQIDDISLCWPERPNDGMIFFRGTDQDLGAWRCDYVARKPTSLGCDT